MNDLGAPTENQPDPCTAVAPPKTKYGWQILFPRPGLECLGGLRGVHESSR